MLRPRLRRMVLGDPPVETGVDRFIRFGLAVAYVLGAIGLVGAAADDRFVGLIAPAGLLFTAIGVLIHTNHRGARDAADARVRNTLTEVPEPWTRFRTALLIIVGVGWTLMGAGVFVSAL